MTDETWNYAPPSSESLGDRDVDRVGEHLLGKRVALLIAGGIAAYKTPSLVRALRRQGADVTVFASDDALRFVTKDAIEWSSTNPLVTSISAESEHLSDTKPFDVFVLPQATYNTINKIRHGIADSTLTTTMASALGRLERGECAVVVCPTMHGSMHNSILTESMRHLAQMGVHVPRPRDAYGKHNLLPLDELVAITARQASTSPLRGVPILVTAGGTVTPIDNVRRLSNRFRGRLGIHISQELWLRGADVVHVHGDGPLAAPAYIPQHRAATYEAYRTRVHAVLAQQPLAYGVFSAAVADYQPAEVAPGKIPSGGALRQLDLVPTAKVIDEVRHRHPTLKMVTFKYEEGLPQEALMEIARRRVDAGHLAVVANRGEESSAQHQVAHLVTKDGEITRMTGKANIAVAIADFLSADHLASGQRQV